MFLLLDSSSIWDMCAYTLLPCVFIPEFSLI